MGIRKQSLVNSDNFPKWKSANLQFSSLALCVLCQNSFHQCDTYTWNVLHRYLYVNEIEEISEGAENSCLKCVNAVL